MQMHIAGGLENVLQDDNETVHGTVYEKVFVLTIVIIRQSGNGKRAFRGAMQKLALSENGYRVIPIGAKRVFPRPLGSTKILSRCFCMNDERKTMIGGI